LHILELDSWWREHRDKAPDLFEQELSIAFRTRRVSTDLSVTEQRPLSVVPSVIARQEADQTRVQKNPRFEAHSSSYGRMFRECLLVDRCWSEEISETHLRRLIGIPWRQIEVLRVAILSELREGVGANVALWAVLVDRYELGPLNFGYVTDDVARVPNDQPMGWGRCGCGLRGVVQERNPRGRIASQESPA
jgi:hypothetical protein